MTKQKTRNRPLYSGKGFYFSGSKEYAKGYTVSNGTFSGRVIEAYINIKNPYIAKYPGGIDTEKLKAQGYDGVYSPSNDFYILFDPSQIKSADPITYDDNGNIISLSERFNEKKEDIRFSRKFDPYFGLTDEQVTRYNIENGKDFISVLTENRAASNNSSSIGWVYRQKIFSVIENKLFLQKISEINQGSKAFIINEDGEYELDIENKIVYTKGDYLNPDISRIIEIMSPSATVVTQAKEMIRYVASRPERAQMVIQFFKRSVGLCDIFEYRAGDVKAVRWEINRSERKTRTQILRDYRKQSERRRNAEESKNSEEVTTNKPSSQDGGFSAPQTNSSRKLDPVAAENRRLTRENEKLQAASDILQP